MKNLSDLIELISSLTKEEIKVARNYLKAFDNSQSEEELKGLKLFNLIHRTSPAPTDDEAKLTVYNGNISNKTFYRLTTRLHARLLESLILDVNINRRDVLSEQYRVKHFVRKSTIQASLLMGRGKHNQAQQIYEKIIKRSIEFEIYDELLETLRFRQQTIGLRKGKKEYDRYEKEIEHYELCRRALIRTKEIYHRIIINIDFKADPVDNKKILEKSIQEINGLYQKTGSKNIAYYLYYLKTELHQRANDYQKAEKEILSLVSLIRDHKAVYMKRSLGSAYLELANNNLLTHDFSKCIDSCSRALPLHAKNSFNHAVTKEIEFLAYFNSGMLDEATKTINFLLKTKELNQSEAIYSKRVYYKACVLFLQGEFKKVEQLLQRTKEIEADKEGWNIYVRLLWIMTLAETSDDIRMDFKIESARKHIERVSKEKAVNPRNSIMLKFLSTLIKHNFNYKKAIELEQSRIQRLSMASGINSWKVRSPELIKFHEWISSKARNKPYRFKNDAD